MSEPSNFEELIEDMGYDRPEGGVMSIDEKITRLYHYPDRADIISALCFKYLLTRSSLIEELLVKIVEYKKFNVMERIEIAKTISNIQLLHGIMTEQGVSFITIMDILKFSTTTDKDREGIKSMVDYTIDHFPNHGIEILQFLKSSLSKDEWYCPCIKRLLDKTPSEASRVRILCFQILGKEYIPQMIELALDETLDTQSRADVADCLISFGETSVGEKVILSLSGSNGVGLYHNAQNVHKTSVSEFYEKGINFLFANGTLAATPGSTFQTVSETILKSHPELKLCLARIELDNILYCGKSIRQVFIQLYNYIQTHRYSRLLNDRLLEEMADMQYTCSSGYISRLINVLSGVDIDMELNIKDQIEIKLQQKVQQKILGHPDCEHIVADMISNLIGDKSFLLSFIRQHIPDLRNELYLEFRNEITDTHFDEWFNIALVRLTGV
jgi:hypothetical protein